MNSWRALRDVFLTTLVTGLMVTVIWLLLSTGYAQILVPTPEDTAQQFLLAVSAGRPEGARSLLLDPAQESLIHEAQAWLARHPAAIQEMNAREIIEQAGSATVRLEVTFTGPVEDRLSFQLQSDHHLWKIISQKPGR